MEHLPVEVIGNILSHLKSARDAVIASTTGLQNLSIFMDDDVDAFFSLISWLMFCLKLEKFALINPELVMSDTQTAMEHSSSPLKDIFVGNLGAACDYSDEDVDLYSISISFSKLSYLSLHYYPRHGTFHHNFRESFQMENVTILELGWSDTSDPFSNWVAKLLEKCPKLKKLIICGAVSEINNHEECQNLAHFITYFVELMRKYLHIEVQFGFE
uniref:F-box domain-containing protein n=1 Tax=Cucumis sativus TaxID=3659 RepID=A0A0A0LEK3_CUCSA